MFINWSSFISKKFIVIRKIIILNYVNCILFFGLIINHVIICIDLD